MLPEVQYRTYKNGENRTKDGSLNLKDKVRNPKLFAKNDWMLVYSAINEKSRKEDEEAI